MGRKTITDRTLEREIGMRIRLVRQMAGLSIATLAEAVGVS
jgi:hypothetical protein